MNDLRELWTLVKADLHRALSLLPDSADKQSLRRYHEFIEHNELELACDALEESVKDHAVTGEFWLALCDAARKMKLAENATRYEMRAKGETRV